MPLKPLTRSYEVLPAIWTDEDGRCIQAFKREANCITFLNRADAMPLWSIEIKAKGQKPQRLGVLHEYPQGIYRILSYGETASPADQSPEFSWQAAVDALYADWANRRTARRNLRQLAEVA